MSQPQVSIIRVLNPFNPTENTRETWPLGDGPKTLRDIFPAVVTEHVVSINGKIVLDDGDNFSKQYIQDGDNLVVCPVPAGGGDSSKMILRLVAMVAIMYFAWWAAPYIAGAGASATTVSMVAMGITMVGGLVVNALLPVKPMETSFGQEDFSSSPTYGVDGPKNSSVEGIPVPVAFGTHRMAGNIIGMYTENLGGDTQHLYMLFNAGEGPIAGISGVQINNQPAEYWGAICDVRLGMPDQTPISWFSDTITPKSYNQKLNAGEWHYYTSTEPIDKVRFDVLFPTGLYQVNSQTGKYEAFTVWTEFWYKKSTEPDAAYRPLPVNTIQTGVSETLYFRFELAGLFNSGIPVWDPVAAPPAGSVLVGYEDLSLTGGTITYNDEFWGKWERKISYGAANGRVDFADKFTSPLRRSVQSELLDSGNTTYTFAFRRASNDESPTAQPWAIFDDVWITDINEIVTDDIAYNNTALLAIKMKITDQLNSIPTVTYLNHGILCNYWDFRTDTWKYISTDNPAWITYNMMTNPRWGGGIDASRLNIDQWKQWGIHCHMEYLRFNGVFDTASNLWDAMQYVFRAGHAAPVRVGTRWSVAVEKQADPVMMFSVANIVQGSFREMWAPVSERVNEIDVTFFDKANDYKSTTIKVVDQDAQASGSVRNTGITMFGIVEAERAYREGLMLLNMNKYIKQTVEFDAPVEAIACTVGDVVLVQHDMPQWGYAGRIENPLATNRITLDREVPFEGGKTYKFLTLFDSINRMSGTITSMPSSNWLSISGVSPYTKAKRVKIGNLADVAIVACQSNGVQIEDQGAVVPAWVGQTATLVDTDVIEERDVANVIGSDVVLTSPLPQLPNMFGQWMYGETNKVKKPFRIRGISGTDFHTRTITAIEYNASVYPLYGTPYPTPNYSALDPVVEPVTYIGVHEELIKIGQAISTHVTLMWEATQETYTRGEVFVSVDGGPHVSRGYWVDRFSMDVNDGTKLSFKVIAVDALGQRCPWYNIGYFNHTVVGKTAAPSNVTSINAIELINGIQLSWNPVSDLDLRGYEVRVGDSWNSGEIVVQNFAGTSFLDKKRFAGAYTYRVKAVDVLGNYSATEATVTWTVDAMPTVTGFSAALVQRQVVFNWNAVSNINLSGYEIRVGSTWASATPVVTNYNGTTFAINRPTPADYKYWIAAVSNLAQYSTPVSYDLTVPRIATPTNVHVEPRVGDLLVTWDAINDIDLKHYEIRVGNSWETGQVLVTGYSGTSFIDGKRGVGTYHYMVKAYGSPGNESVSVGSYDLTLVAPASVTGFDCVQNGNRIEFRWNPNPELDLIGYEIREGATWSTGVKIVEQLGTTYTMPSSSIAQDRTFWIKAIVEPGIESDVAVFSTTDIAEPTDRNVIVTVDEFGTGFANNKYNMTVVSGKLQLNAGMTYGEYTFPVTLPQLYRARNSLAVAFDAIIPDTETWTTATYPWNSAQAQRTWTIAGDIGAIGLEFYISRYVGLPVGYLESFPLSGTTTGDGGTTATTALNVTYAAGRYLNGARIGATTQLLWTKTVAQHFNVTFWARIEDTAGTRQVFWKGVKSGGTQWLDVSYNPANSKFELRDNASNTVQVTPPGTFAIGDQIFFGVVQTASTRKLYVGQMGKGTAQGSGAFTPIGPLATFQLHP